MASMLVAFPTDEIVSLQVQGDSLDVAKVVAAALHDAVG
jgi:hypothetical protein